MARAAASVHNAPVRSNSQRLTAELGQVLTSLAVIDQAPGIVMSRTGGGA